MSAYGQAGLTNSGLTQQEEIARYKASQGFDNSKKSSTSAIEQLESMTGKKLSMSQATNMNISSSAKKKPTSVSSAVSTQNMMKAELMSGVASALFGMLFSGNSKAAALQQENERQKAILLAQQAAEEKRVKDSIEQARHAKMMESYKRIDDVGAVQFKQLSTTGLQMKPLGDGAPLTQEERERQNIIKRGAGITWDFNSWAQVQPENTVLQEPPYVPEANGPDEYFDKVLEKIEDFEGGKVAALTGRAMKNIKNETMSYLKDASNAALSGDIARMDEMGNFDLKKLTSNALLATSKETAKSYYAKLKDNIEEKIKDQNFELWEGGGEILLQKANIYAPVSNDWKIPLTR